MGKSKDTNGGIYFLGIERVRNHDTGIREAHALGVGQTPEEAKHNGIRFLRRAHTPKLLTKLLSLIPTQLVSMTRLAHGDEYRQIKEVVGLTYFVGRPRRVR